MTTTFSVQTKIAGDDTLSHTIAAYPGTPVDFAVTANDFTSMPASAAIVSVGTPAHGTATGAGGSVRYTADAAYIGPDSLTYIVQGPVAGSKDTATVRFQVVPGPYVTEAITPPPGATITTFSDSRTALVGLDDAGDAAGNLTQADGSKRAFRWHSGSMDILNSHDGDGVATAMNNAGVVAGTSGGRPVMWPAGSSEPVFLYADPTIIDTPIDISVNGDILLTHSVVWSPTAVDSLKIPRFVPKALDDYGDVLGVDQSLFYDDWTVVGRNPTRSVKYSGLCGFHIYYPVAMNGLGTVLVDSDSGLCMSHQNGTTINLTTVSGGAVQGLIALNDRDWVVVTAKNLGTALYINGSYMPLNVVVSPSITVSAPKRINHRGDILAVVRDVSTQVETWAVIKPIVTPP
jgi:hypothetical protein